MKTRDSARRINNALLVFYLAVAIWATASIKGILATPSQQSDKPRSKVSKALSFKRKSDKADLYEFIMKGIFVFGTMYVIRRPEWASLLIEWTGAWKSKQIDRSKMMLVQHGIAKPKDREWVLEMLKELERKEKQKPNNKVSIPDDAKPK